MAVEFYFHQLNMASSTVFISHYAHYFRVFFHFTYGLWRWGNFQMDFDSSWCLLKGHVSEMASPPSSGTFTAPPRKASCAVLPVSFGEGMEVKGNESNEVTQKVNSLYIYFHFFFLYKSVFFALPSLPYHLSS